MVDFLSEITCKIFPLYHMYHCLIKCNVIVRRESISFARRNFSLLNISIEQVLLRIHKTKVYSWNRCYKCETNIKVSKKKKKSWSKQNWLSQGVRMQMAVISRLRIYDSYVTASEWRSPGTDENLVGWRKQVCVDWDENRRERRGKTKAHGSLKGYKRYPPVWPYSTEKFYK